MVWFIVCRKCKHMQFINLLGNIKHSDQYERKICKCKCQDNKDAMIIFTVQDVLDYQSGRVDFKIEKVVLKNDSEIPLSSQGVR